MSLSSEKEVDLPIPEEVSPEFEILEQNVPKVMSMIVELPEPDEDETEPEQKSDTIQKSEQREDDKQTVGELK